MLSHSKKINTQLFKKVLSDGKTYHSTYFLIMTLKLSIKNKSKFAVVVSKRIIKKAVLRNLLRRRLFNIIKEVYKNTSSSYAIIFFLKKGVEELKFEDIKKEIVKVFNDIKI